MTTALPVFTVVVPMPRLPVPVILSRSELFVANAKVLAAGRNSPFIGAALTVVKLVAVLNCGFVSIGLASVALVSVAYVHVGLFSVALLMIALFNVAPFCVTKVSVTVGKVSVLLLLIAGAAIIV